MVRRLAALRLVVAGSLAVAVGCAAAGSAGCSRASQEGEAKQWATPPPGKDIAVPEQLHIDVVIDGAAAAAITGERLRAARPDFVDDEHKAWLIPTLVPEAAAADSSIEAVSGTGVSVTFARPTADGLQPVLFLTRRGDIIVAALDPKDPFPRYHGQGGRLRRAGDSMPRVSPVARLEIRHTRP